MSAAEYDPVFALAHDYGSHHHGCPMAESGAPCTCGFLKAYAEAERYVVTLRAAARVEVLRQALNNVRRESTYRGPDRLRHIARVAIEADDRAAARSGGEQPDNGR